MINCLHGSVCILSVLNIGLIYASICFIGIGPQVLLCFAFADYFQCFISGRGECPGTPSPQMRKINIILYIAKYKNTKIYVTKLRLKIDLPA